jgi:Putative transposase
MKCGRGQRTDLVMTPVEFLARQASLVPPPRIPLVRYFGVLADGFTLAFAARSWAVAHLCSSTFLDSGQQASLRPLRFDGVLFR